VEVCKTRALQAWALEAARARRQREEMQHAVLLWQQQAAASHEVRHADRSQSNHQVCSCIVTVLLQDILTFLYAASDDVT
jgi:hypothetical protein